MTELSFISPVSPVRPSARASLGAWAGPLQPNWSHVLLDPGAAPVTALSLSGAGSCGREGRATTGARYVGGWSVHPILSLRGTPTVTHGTLVTRSLGCCGTTGGSCPYYQGNRYSEEESKGGSDLQSHLCAEDKDFCDRWGSFSRVESHFLSEIMSTLSIWASP